MSSTVPAPDRLADLERHGRAYGELHLALAFTDGIGGDDAKRITRKGWPATTQLADGDFGAALFKGRGENRNPAVVLGASGLIGVDVDGPEGVTLLLELLRLQRLPRTVTVTTGKGYHCWFRPPAAAVAAKIELGPEGLEIAKDGYLVCPPALHPSGRIYRFAEGRAPWDIAPAELPRELLDVFLAHAKRDRVGAIASTGPITEGGRHRVGAEEESIVAALLIENERRCTPPKDERVVRALAHDMATRYQPEAHLAA